MHGQHVTVAEGPIDREAALAEHSADGLKEVAALSAAVQVDVHFSCEGGLIAQVQQALRTTRQKSCTLYACSAPHRCP